MQNKRQLAYYIMVFFSGFAGLLYQVLWMRQLGLLFGNTSHAAAATLAAFFAGLAGGSWFWGKRSITATNPLKTYAFLEVGIGGTALLYFGILSLFHGIYPSFYQSLGPGPQLLAVKGVLALLLVFPPAFFMGGTIPILGEFLIQRKDVFGTTTARLYGINTVGAALGAFLTGFFFVQAFGFNRTCATGIAITALIAISAFWLSRKQHTVPGEDADAKPEPETAEVTSKKSPKKSKKTVKKGPRTAPTPVTAHWVIYALAFVSGFSVLALEVLWTRIFAQVHENSVYSFSSVIIVVLVCLAGGALIASKLAKLKQPPMLILMILTILSGISICISPFILMKVTNDFEMMTATVSFLTFMSRVFGISFATIGLPCLLLGTVFPFLMKSEEQFAEHPGKSIGYLTAVNTVGAILGALACGFIMLQFFGMWRVLQLFTAAYLLIGLFLPTGNSGFSLAGKSVGILFLFLSLSVLSPTGLPITGTDPRRGSEKILETWETSDCTVAVVESEFGSRTIKVNSNYTLGSTGAIPHQVFQTRIPLFIYPETNDLFYLGLGTGITAGSSLNTDFFPNIKKVVACELVPEVVIAAKKYIAEYEGEPDYTNGLFKDPRSQVIVEDGRHYLMATDNTFDMINADLFLTYRSGAGSLYSLEHFKSVKKRLNPGGVFVQWLPHYQITKLEFGIIARTMLEAFDQVTLWRNNFQPGGEIMALMGHTGSGVLPACTIDSRRDKLMSVAGMTYMDMQNLQLPLNEQTTLLFYAGNITAARQLFDSYPINTDDNPIIEYMAPKSLREETGDMPPQFLGPPLADMVDKLFEITPPDKDPVLKNRTPENQRLPIAGAAFHRAWIGRTFNDIPAWKNGWKTFVNEWLNTPPESNEN